MDVGTTEPRPKVSLIIPCRNEIGHIEQCLRDVLAFEIPDGGFEVVVADGTSDDGTRELIAAFAGRDSRVRIVDNARRNTPCGLNAAIVAARGEIIVRIDVHTQYARDYLLQCVSTLEATGADNVGGPWIAVGKTYIQRAIAAAFASRFAVGGAKGHQANYEGPVDTVYLGCWRRGTLERIGYFDEEFVRNQDDELNLRLVRAGGTVWQASSIRSWYTPRASLILLFRQYFQYGYWKVRVIQKHRVPASIRHLVPGGFVGCLLLLSVMSTSVGPAAWMLTALLGVYTALLVAAAVDTGVRSGWSLIPVLPAVFACYHLGYGIGFLAGVWDFFVIRRSGRFEGLTRK